VSPGEREGSFFVVYLRGFGSHSACNSLNKHRFFIHNSTFNILNLKFIKLIKCSLLGLKGVAYTLMIAFAS